MTISGPRSRDFFVSFWGQKYADPFSLFLAPETDIKSLFLAPEIVIFCQFLGPEILEPETDVMVQFLAPEIVIMGKRNFMLFTKKRIKKYLPLNLLIQYMPEISP